MTSRTLQNYLFSLPCCEEEATFFCRTPPLSHLNVYEDERSVVVEAALPGLNKEEVDVIFHEGVLTIRGNKKEEAEDQKRKYYQKADRTFNYQMAVPGLIDENEDPKAEFKNGITKVTFHKQKKAEPKRIVITT